jgi:pre-mRNA-splicing factor ATP-dependent RNA helicase DHX15/PRP43
MKDKIDKNDKINKTKTDDDNNIGILDPDGKNLNPLNNQAYSDNYKKLAKLWSKFPAYDNAKNTIDIIKLNQVILITSGTGSGKTVLIPKYVLHQTDYKGHIMISLPKQIIAQSAAEYASATLDVNLGEHIGYKYKGSDTKYAGNNPNLLYATDGTIVARLLNDPLLTGIDAVVIDEAHERKVQIDFMLYLLRNVVRDRKDFKLIIMSATVNSEVFNSYFAQYKFAQIDIGGKTNYEIKSIFVSSPVGPTEYISKGLEIIDDLLLKKESGKISDILFFVTSVSETFDVALKIRNKYSDKEVIEIYSGMSQEKQDALSKKETENQRILVSTNVAESSLTVDGIKYVIDSGYELLSYFDPVKRAKVLEKGLITHAQAKQRMGRAGRTAPGICYHLYTHDEFENKMKKFPEPSIRLSNITSETLKLLHIDKVRNIQNILTILGSLIEPPKELYIKTALKTLKDLNLITNDNINPLGDYVANSQLEPDQALSLLYAYQLNCMREVFAILLLIDNIKNNLNELFIVPTDKNKNDKDDKNDKFRALQQKFMDAKNKLCHKYGDHLTLLKIFSKFNEYKTEETQKEFCHKYFVKYSILQKTKHQYDKIKYKIKDIIKNFIEMEDSKPYLLENIQTLSELSIDYKILYALKNGYILNLGFYNPTIRAYRTLYADKVNISKDSCINDTDKNIFYHELFVTKSFSDLNIVSIIPDKIRNL